MIHILVSACLIGQNCKWDGKNNRDQKLLDFMERTKGIAEFHPVCPEEMGDFPHRVRLLRSGRKMRS